MNTEKRESGEIEAVLQVFRQNVREAAVKPDAFWTKQRDGILEKLGRPSVVIRWRPAWIWVPASIAVALCFFISARRSEVPLPDIAAGYDQKLLVEVEQALRRGSPWALAPAELITEEIERGTVSLPSGSR
ncbi:MAG: hypothetical protein JXA73_12960 [Acidobacteria bacterium]|nr:hypothetical protein [Acidobacteriota bacterium]